MKNFLLKIPLDRLLFSFLIVSCAFQLSAQTAPWCTEVEISNATGFNQIYGDPELLIVNGNPAAVYAWSDIFGADIVEIFYVRANDSKGTTWGTPQVVATGMNDNDGTSIAIINGNPAIAFHDRRGGGNHSLRYVRANDANGTSWGSIVIIESGSQRGQWCSLTTIDGKPAISHHEGSSDDLRYSYSSDVNGASGWSTVSVDTDNAGTFSKLLEVQGRPAIAYTRNQSGISFDAKYVRASNSTGSSWGTPVNLTASITTTAGRYIDMEIVNGNPAVVFNETYHVTDQHNTIYIRATDNTGSSWGSLQTLFSCPGEDNEVRDQSIGFVNGVPVVSFHHIDDPFSGGDRYLMYMSATDANGSSWNAPETIKANNTVVNYTDLIEIDSKPALIYINSNQRVKYIYRDCGVSTAPEIAITDASGDAIADGANLAAANATNSTDFGSLCVVGSTSLSFTYTVTNSGDANLDFTGSPLVAITGGNAGDFSVTTQIGTDPLPHTTGNTTTFIVEFNPTAAGVRSTTISIANDDSDENPYDFVVKGTGINPTISIAATTAIIAEDDGSTDLVYRFTRDCTVGALVVYFEIEGTAGDSDYSVDVSGATTYSAATNTGTVTFADGSSTADLTVSSTDDSMIEASETVVMKVKLPTP